MHTHAHTHACTSCTHTYTHTHTPQPTNTPLPLPATSTELTSLEEVENFLSKDEHAVMGFFSESGSALENAFVATASSLRDDFRFGFTREAEVIEKYSHKE